MSAKLIKAILLAEDNPADARLLREMLNEQGSHSTELTHVDCTRTDPDRLAQLVTDLLSNAIEFFPPDNEVAPASVSGEII
jgi:signal transduction histidine kinase